MLWVHEVRNGHGFQVHKVELMLGEWVIRGQPTVLFWDCQKQSRVCANWTKNHPCVVFMNCVEIVLAQVS